MNSKITIRKIVFVVALFTITNNFAQLSIPFKIRYQGFVNGDMTIIANNSVNRLDFTSGPNEPYYNLTSYAKLNDEFDMAYIDIDNDKSTFSSSSAELYLENSNQKKVVYAGLYWSGTYRFNAGTQKSEKKFISTDASRGTFSSVKLKLPNKEKYIDVSGQVIFDGAGKNEFDAIAPYAVYADITDYLKELSNASGVYSVANVKATQGIIEGGVSAGWTIFIVYEDHDISGKFITSFDGFAGVTDKSTDIVFNGFQTLPVGSVRAKIACSALEGDNNLKGDQLLFKTNEGAVFTQLSTSTREQNNFFNSTITIENHNFISRYPDSKNTLGYDACMFTIPNPENSVIGNNIKESTLRLKSFGDRYFMFFTAFGVEVTPPNEEIIYESADDKPLKVASKNKLIKFIPANNDFLVDETKTSLSYNRNIKNANIESKSNIIEVQTIKISGEEPSFYIIANIYKNKQSAIEFITFLKLKKIESNYFINKLNNYHYVYLKKCNELNKTIDLFNSKLDDSYNERIQILSVNKNNNELIAELNRSETILNVVKKDETITKKELFDVRIVSIPNEPKGYYIVANVFSVTENSNNFLNLLKSKGFSPKVLLNPINNYKYVYLKKLDDENEAKSLYLSKLNNTYQDKIWILSVNNNIK